MIRDLSPSAVYMGVLAAFVGYSASFAIVLAGISAVGATEAQAETGLFAAALGMGICSIWLPFATRTPAAVAWSTPGAAFLAGTAVLPGGFQEAVGALIICASLIVVTGFVPSLGRMVAAIPKPVANALLAGVLLQLCFAPALALGTAPYLTLPVILAWVFGLSWNRVAAMPLAVGMFLVVLYISGAPAESASNHVAAAESGLAIVVPEFSLQSAISIALPLYLVTMAGQNIPGFAVLELNNYPVRRPFLIRSTGVVSLFIAPFGGIPVNMSAITASMMAGEDAGKEPAGRYWAAIVSGVTYIALAFVSGSVVTLTSLAPTGLITALAGLALIPAFVAAVTAAFNRGDQLEAPAFTFLISASGMSLFGVSGAFWGILLGGTIWGAKRLYAQGRE